MHRVGFREVGDDRTVGRRLGYDTGGVSAEAAASRRSSEREASSPARPTSVVPPPPISNAARPPSPATSAPAAAVAPICMPFTNPPYEANTRPRNRSATRCTMRLRIATVSTPFATPPTTNSATASGNDPTAAAANTAAPFDDGRERHRPQQTVVGEPPGDQVAPPTMPTSHAEASTPYPQAAAAAYHARRTPRPRCPWRRTGSMSRSRAKPRRAPGRAGSRGTPACAALSSVRRSRRHLGEPRAAAPRRRSRRRCPRRRARRPRVPTPRGERAGQHGAGDHARRTARLSR